MGNELAVINHALAAMSKELASVLPANVPTKRFLRIASEAITDTPSLLECDRGSLYKAVKDCAADGLVIDGREAAIVPFYDSKAKIKKAKYMPMVTGIIKRARNSGDIESIYPVIRYEKDLYDVDYGKRHPVTFKPADGDRGKPVGAMCIVWYKNGGMEFEYMAESEILIVRECSKQPKSLQWTTFWTEGWKKTVLRRLFKRVPMSSELDRVVTNIDNEYDFSAQPAAEQPGPEKKLTRAEQRVAEQQGGGEKQATEQGATDAEYEEMAPVDAGDEDPI